jgi:hypothetical protein
MARKKTTTSRKRKGRYHTGIYNSPKCSKPIEYRSGWERTVCEYLDNDVDVVAYAYESLEIQYLSNLKSKKVRKYIPDFLVWYANGKVKMVEVKRENMLTNLRVQKKAAAAKVWCAAQTPKVDYEFWTDKMILPLQRAAKLREKCQQTKSK